MKRMLRVMGARSLMLALASVAMIANVRVVVDALPLAEAGAYFALVSVAQFLLVWDFGLGMGVAMSVAQADGPGSARLGFRVATTASRTLASWAALVAVVAWIVAGQFSLHVLHLDHGATAAVVLGVGLAVTSLVFQPYVRACEGRGQTTLVVLCDGLRPALTLGAGILAGVLHWGLLGFVVAWGVANCCPGVAVACTSWWRAGQDPPDARVTKVLPADLARLGFGYQAATVGNSLNTMLDQAIVSAVLGPASVVAHQGLVRAVQLARSLFGSFWLFFWPRMFTDAGLSDRRREYQWADRALFVLGAVLAVGVTAVGPELLHLWLGGAVSVSHPAAAVAGALMVVYACETMPSAVTSSPRLQMIKACCTGSSAVVNVVLSWLLAAHLGYIGPMVATLLTYGLVYVLPLRRMARGRLSTIQEPRPELRAAVATGAEPDS